MGKLQREIALLSLTVEPGTTERVVCPACRGGTGGEISLAITKDESGVILYKCHRASCEASGRVGGAGGVPRPRPPRVRPYTGPLRTLSAKEYDYLRGKYNLLADVMPYIRYSDPLNRFMLPCMSPKMVNRGWTARSFVQEPKALAYIALDEPFQGWIHPKQPYRDMAVVVEDYFSACKVAHAGYLSVHLNGTHITPDGAMELRGYETVILALDKGTMPQMLKLKARYGHLWKNVIIWSLDKDLKYETTTRIREAAEDGKTSFECRDQEPGSLRGDILSDTPRHTQSGWRVSLGSCARVLRKGYRSRMGGTGRTQGEGTREGTEPEAG